MATDRNRLYRLYIDESGDHRYGRKIISPTNLDYGGDRICIHYDEYPELEDSRNRYLSLTGCIIRAAEYEEPFCIEMEKLKKNHFHYDPDDPVIFHREDMVNYRKSFYRLKDLEKRAAFNNDLLNFMKDMPYIIITVVIDKKRHIQQYGTAAFHPYHYCLTAMLERYCGFLSFNRSNGDVLAESRGGREDEKLKEAYRTLYKGGSRWREKDHFQKVLTSNEIKLKKKTHNIAGLQLADLLAHPVKTHILVENGCLTREEDFGTKIVEVAEAKFNRHYYTGRIHGYGKVFLQK